MRQFSPPHSRSVRAASSQTSRLPLPTSRRPLQIDYRTMLRFRVAVSTRAPACCRSATNHVAFSCDFVRFSCPVALPRTEGGNVALAVGEGCRTNKQTNQGNLKVNGDNLQADPQAHHFSRVSDSARRRAFVYRPKGYSAGIAATADFDSRLRLIPNFPTRPPNNTLASGFAYSFNTHAMLHRLAGQSS